MQDWANLIREIALLISGVVAGITAWNALRKLSHDVSKDDKEELRADRDLYRDRWLESEKAFDEIDAENDKLRKKIKRLENKIDNLKTSDLSGRNRQKNKDRLLVKSTLGQTEPLPLLPPRREGHVSIHINSF